MLAGVGRSDKEKPPLCSLHLHSQDAFLTCHEHFRHHSGSAKRNLH